jgi:hypothetical protein
MFLWREGKEGEDLIIRLSRGDYKKLQLEKDK